MLRGVDVCRQGLGRGVGVGVGGKGEGRGGEAFCLIDAFRFGQELVFIISDDEKKKQVSLNIFSICVCV